MTAVATKRRDKPAPRPAPVKATSHKPWIPSYTLREDAEEANPPLPKRGPGAVQHEGTRGRRSTRFPDLNIGATAERLGITKAHLAKVLGGDSRPSMALALKLANVLNKDLPFVASLYNNEEVPANGTTKKKARKK